MTRRALFAVLIGIGSVVGTCLPLPAQGKSEGKGRGRGHEENAKQENAKAGGNGATPKPGSPSFRREDYSTIQRYYAGPRDLPPGLRKKYARTGQLPPGWEKKMQPFPPELVRVLPPLPPNADRGFIDGVAVTYDRKTRLILDSIDLISRMATR